MFLLRMSTQSDGKHYLLALVSVLAQSLLTLVSGHLVALVLFSVRHNFYGYLLLVYYFGVQR